MRSYICTHTHKQSLWSQRSYIRAVYTSNMEEARSGTIRVHDCSRATFLAFLEYVYTCTIQESMTLSQADGWELWHLAELYDIKTLKTWLCGRLNEENVVHVARHATHVRDAELLSACKACASTCLPHLHEASLTGLAGETARELMRDYPVEIERYRFAEKWLAANQDGVSELDRTEILGEVDVMAILAPQTWAALSQSESESVMLLVSLMRAYANNPHVQEMSLVKLQSLDIRPWPVHVQDAVCHAILACMRAHVGNQTVMRHATWMLYFTASPSLHVRERIVIDFGGIEVLVGVMNAHRNDVFVQKPACATLRDCAMGSVSRYVHRNMLLK